MLSILLFHVRLLHIYCFLSITYICICIVPFSNGTNPGWRSEHAGAMQLILLPYGPPLDAGVNLAVWPRTPAVAKAGSWDPYVQQWCGTHPQKHIDCNIYILLYHLYRIWRSNTFSVGLQLYHTISCSSYLHNTFYCSPEKNILPSRAPGRLPVMAPSPRSPSKMLSPRHQPVALVKTNTLDD